jgi:hypothetical protein
MDIPCNVGGPERFFRIGLGVVLILMVLIGAVGGTVAFFTFVIGAVALGTGIIKYCPISALTGRNTCESAGGE